MRIVIVRQAHVAQLAVIGARHDGQVMMIFRYALDAVARELERAELQLAFHDGGRRDVGEGFTRVLHVRDEVFSRLVERHESPEHLREGPGHGVL